MAKLPLEGIRVVDLTVVWAGPFATMLLADLGAEVIRVETVHHFQNATRGIMAFPPPILYQIPMGRDYYERDGKDEPWNRDAMGGRQLRNKLSCCIDLTRPKGLEVFKKLVGISDVFIENNTARFTESIGITYDVLSQWNPRIVYVNMPGWGMSGPHKYWLGYGVNVEATTGHTWIRGYPDEEHPLHNTNVFHMDASGGGTAALAIILALYHRERTGKGQYIDIAGAETAVAHFPDPILDYQMNRRIWRTIGNRDFHGAVQGCYRCRGEDRWAVITISNDEEWQAFSNAIGNPEWTKNEKFADVISRYQNHDELDKHIAEWCSHHDHYEVMFILQRAGVPAGPVIDHDEAIKDPQLAYRGFYEVVDHKPTGVHLFPGVLFKMSRTPLSVRTPPCKLGEHNDYVFKQLLKMSDEEIAELEADNYVIGGTAYLPGA